jgi:F-type H+-transporting ATPase subunit b
MKKWKAVLAIIAILASLISFVPVVQASESHASEASHESGESHESSWFTTIAQWFNFIILLGLLYFFLTRKMRVGDTFKAEADEIQRAIESARKAKEEAELRLKELDEKMATLTQEVAKIKDQAAKDAEMERLRILEMAQAEAKRIVDLANREVDSEVRQAKKQLLQMIGDLSVEKGKKIVETEITDEDQKRLIDEYIGSFSKK